MTLVFITRAGEALSIDTARVVALRQELGSEMAGTVLMRALQEMAVRIAEIRDGQDGADMPAVLRAARRLARVADHVGLFLIARVAGDVACCAMQRDPVALGATSARLASLHAGASADISAVEGRLG